MRTTADVAAMNQFVQSVRQALVPIQKAEDKVESLLRSWMESGQVNMRQLKLALTAHNKQVAKLNDLKLPANLRPGEREILEDLINTVNFFNIEESERETKALKKDLNKLTASKAWARFRNRIGGIAEQIRTMSIPNLVEKAQQFVEPEFKFGPFTVVDNHGILRVRARYWFEVITRANKILKRKGFDYLLYGKLKLEPVEKGFNGTYYQYGDYIVLNTGEQGRPNDRMLYTFIHELGHRLWFKFMDAGARDRFANPWLVQEEQLPAILKRVNELLKLPAGELDEGYDILVDSDFAFAKFLGWVDKTPERKARWIRMLQHVYAMSISETEPLARNDELNKKAFELTRQHIRRRKDAIKSRDASISGPGIETEEQGIRRAQERAKQRLESDFRVFRKDLEKAAKNRVELSMYDLHDYFEPARFDVKAPFGPVIKDAMKMEKIKPSITDYGQTNRLEDFAEVFAMTILGKNKDRAVQQRLQAVLPKGRVLSAVETTEARVADRTTFDIKKEYDRWNRKLWDGRLPTPEFKWTRSKTLGGRVITHGIKGDPSTYRVRSLELSDFLESTYEEMLGLLIHEMIHVAVMTSGKLDNKQHGTLFKRELRRVSKLVPFRIPETEDISHKKVSKQVEANAVGVVLFTKKNTIQVYRAKSMLDVMRAFGRLPSGWLEDHPVEFYVVKDRELAKFPVKRKFTKGRIASYPVDAEQVARIRDGKKLGELPKKRVVLMAEPSSKILAEMPGEEFVTAELRDFRGRKRATAAQFERLKESLPLMPPTVSAAVSGSTNSSHYFIDRRGSEVLHDDDMTHLGWATFEPQKLGIEPLDYQHRGAREFSDLPRSIRAAVWKRWLQVGIWKDGSYVVVFTDRITKSDIKKIQDVIEDAPYAYYPQRVSVYQNDRPTLVSGSVFMEAASPRDLVGAATVTSTDLDLSTASEYGYSFRTGKPVTFRYRRNTEKAPNLGAKFQQNIEPSGRYIITDFDPSYRMPKWEQGVATFKSPLVLTLNSGTEGIYDDKSWKARLYAHYGKKGRALSAALLRDGYDAVVTTFRGNTREIVALKPDQQLRPETEATAAARSLAQQLTSKMEELLRNFSAERSKEVAAWFEETFERIKQARTPRGGKEVKKVATWMLWELKNRPRQSASQEKAQQQIAYVWKNKMQPLVPQLVKLFSDESGRDVPVSIKVGKRIYENKVGLSGPKLRAFVASLEDLWKSLKGWRKDALKGTLNVVLAGPKDFRGTAAGVYRSAQDALFVRATPKVMKRQTGTYGSPDYILVHELAHRYERKNRIPADFEQQRWWTTPYSRKDGEQFAELFALGHFGIKNWGTIEFGEKLDRFETVMRGGSTAVGAAKPEWVEKIESGKGTVFIGIDDGEPVDYKSWLKRYLMFTKSKQRLDVEGYSLLSPVLRGVLQKLVRQYPPAAKWSVRSDGPAQPIKRLLKSRGPRHGMPKHLYHGTSTELLPRILKEGLKPRTTTSIKPTYQGGAKEGRPERVYLASFPSLQATHFAAREAARKHGGEPVVLRIKTKPLTKRWNDFKADEDFKVDDYDWTASLYGLGTVAYEGVVPPSAIQVFERMRDRDWYRTKADREITGQTEQPDGRLQLPQKGVIGKALQERSDQIHRTAFGRERFWRFIDKAVARFDELPDWMFHREPKRLELPARGVIRDAMQRRSDEIVRAELDRANVTAANEPELYHTTSLGALAKVLQSRTFKAKNYDNPFISFSEKPYFGDISGNDAVIVLDRSALRNRVMPVEYTEQWYDRYPEQASYIAGEGWREQYQEPEDCYDEEGWANDECLERAYREAELDSFLFKENEREWIGRSSGDLRLPAEAFKRIVVPKAKLAAVEALVRKLGLRIDVKVLRGR